MSKGISPQIEEKIKKYQNLQQQIAGLQQQIQQLKIEQLEIDKALKEIEEMPDDEVCYRSIGKLMVKSTIKETKEKLNGQKEFAEARVSISEKSAEKLKKQFDELEETLRKALDSSQ
ncbi:MAG: prefoldin subunit beta [Candidatus Thorarchaeota archaeon]